MKKIRRTTKKGDEEYMDNKPQTLEYSYPFATSNTNVKIEEKLYKDPLGVVTRSRAQQLDEPNVWQKRMDEVLDATLSAQEQESIIRREERDKCQQEMQELLVNLEMEKLLIKKQAKEEYENEIKEIIATYEANKKKEIEQVIREVEERVRREEREKKEMEEFMLEVEERIRREEREKMNKEEESEFILVC